MQTLYNGVPLGAWNPSVASATSVVSITGQQFSEALQWSCRDVINASVEPATPTMQIVCAGWLNAANLAGHPSDGDPWTAGIGMLFTSAAGVQTYLSAATVPSGQGWTFVSGTVTVPATAVTMQPWLQINGTPASLAPGTYFAQAGGMAFSTAFNGWTVLPMPGSPAARSIDFTMGDLVSESTSPFTLQSQVQQWMGADWWAANVSMPPMRSPNSDAWIAWLAGLRGKLCAFQLGDPLKAKPVGTPQGVPVADGTFAGYNLPNSSTLFTRGWRANAQRLLMPGDHLQVGVRLYMVAAGSGPVNADSAGNARISIWPSLREQPGDGQSIVLHNPKGLFALASNVRKYTASYLRVYGLSFDCKERK